MFYEDLPHATDGSPTIQDARGNEVLLDDYGLLVVPASVQDKTQAMNALADLHADGSDGTRREFVVLDGRPIEQVLDTYATHRNRSN